MITYNINVYKFDYDMKRGQRIYKMHGYKLVCGIAILKLVYKFYDTNVCTTYMCISLYAMWTYSRLYTKFILPVEPQPDYFQG